MVIDIMHLSSLKYFVAGACFAARKGHFYPYRKKNYGAGQ
jgi:hypothetical protein